MEEEARVFDIVGELMDEGLVNAQEARDEQEEGEAELESMNTNEHMEAYMVRNAQLTSESGSFSLRVGLIKSSRICGEVYLFCRK